MKLKRLQIWLRAARPRTLVLAISSVLMGLFLVIGRGESIRLDIAILTLITATWLQILSNLANDYGDSIHGADLPERQGPARTVQSGDITAGEMKKALHIVTFFTAVFGSLLVFGAFGFRSGMELFIFLLIGGAAVWAAISYTAGNLPYGYAGFGDLAVFLFFGLVGVLGSYALQTSTLEPILVLPASSLGLFSVAVLNVNNIRDIDSDRRVGKNTIPVRLGLKRARIYHWLILVIGFLATLLYVVLDFSSLWQMLFILSLPFFISNGLAISRKTAAALDPYLKQMSLATLVFVIMFGVGSILALANG